jgi:NAD(P)-dependent dehydrogenase (short-subunit alcohol dehydrogenase family)
VKDFVAAWRGPLHILVNNAGVMATPLTRTAEGWETQFAVPRRRCCWAHRRSWTA